MSNNSKVEHELMKNVFDIDLMTINACVKIQNAKLAVRHVKRQNLMYRCKMHKTSGATGIREKEQKAHVYGQPAVQKSE